MRSRRSKKNQDAGLCSFGKHPWIEGQRICKECQRDRHRINYQQSTLEEHLYRKLYRAEYRAKKRGEFFDLTLEQLMLIWHEQAGRCALTGVEMTRDPSEGWKPTSASIDRIDPNGIYTKGNVRLLCDVVNRMKTTLTDDELKEWCRRILYDR